MTKSDYELLMKVCQYALRKGSDLDNEQIASIDRVMNKLYNRLYSGEIKNALVRNKKMGKRTRVRNR